MIYRFGDCELDTRAGELRRAGASVALQPKPFALLLHLVRQRDRVVPKDELLDSLWSGAAVTESSLTRAVSIARKAIGDDARTRIRSVPRRGYRFAGDVIEFDPEVAAADARPAIAAGELFVGRGRLLASLREDWASASAGRGRAAVLQGEAGIGKTRVAEAFARELEAQGVWVLRGQCRDREGAPAFWLWVQVLRDLGRHTELAALASALGPASAELAALEPEFAGHAAPPDGVRADSPEQNRFLLFDAIERVLALCAGERPLALVLEDVHWASRESLLMIDHLAAALPRLRSMLVLTVREEHRPQGHPLTRTLSTLTQLDAVRLLPVRGFGHAEVAELVNAAAGEEAPDRLVAELVERTDGNPLFLREALRTLSDHGQLRFPKLIPRWRLEQLPERTRDIVRSRLDLLSERAQDLLRAASVLGREFGVAVLASVTEQPRSELLDLLDEAIAAGLVEVLSQPAGSFRFHHALFQEVTYETLLPGRRARLHQRAGETLENQHADDRDGVLSELARHYHRGLTVGDADRAWTTAVAAAEQASRLLAYEQAALHYEQALEALEHAVPVDRAKQEATLLSLGEAHRFAGDRTRRRQVFIGVAEIARQRGSAALLSRAAIGLCDMSEWAPIDDEADAILVEALERLGEGETATRARLLARRAYLHRRSPDVPEPLAREALVLARNANDADALHEALYTLHFVLGGPDHHDERRACVEELAQIAPRGSYRDLAFIGRLDLACDCIAQGRRDDADPERAAARALGGESPHRMLLWHLEVYDAGIDIMEGRYGRAEERVREALALAQMTQHPYGPIMFAAQSFALMRDRGDLRAVLDTIDQSGGATTSEIRMGPSLDSMRALMRAELGNLDGARKIYERLMGAHPRELDRQSDWAFALVELSRTTVLLGDEARARQLIELLEPVAGLHAVIPVSVLYHGPLSRPLAWLHELIGDYDAAQTWLEEAFEQTLAMRARPLAARIRADLAPMLERTGRSQVAASLRAEARAEAEALGMAGLRASLGG